MLSKKIAGARRGGAILLFIAPLLVVYRANAVATTRYLPKNLPKTPAKLIEK